MSDAPRPPAPEGFTIDLSSARTGKRPRKGPPPVVTQTINLSTPKPPKVESAPTAAAASSSAPAATSRPKNAHAKGQRGGRPAHTAPKAEPREARGGGTSLADLLDEATLARLRGA